MLRGTLCVTPLKIADLNRDRLEAVAGEAELGEGENLTHAFGEHTQTVVRQVQALQLGKPEGIEREKTHLL